MIRFEMSEASATRSVSNAVKVAAMAPAASATVSSADELLFPDGGEALDDKAMIDRKSRGRSRKMRGG